MAEEAKYAKVGQEVATGGNHVKQERGRKLRLFAGGGFLPMFSDKSGDNVKNRWGLMAAYANAAALVLVVAVLLLVNPAPVDDKLLWSVPPPPIVQLGVPIPEFSLRLVDGYNTPISGREYNLQMTPAAPFERKVDLNERDTVVARSVGCLETLIYGAELFRSEDFGTCAPGAEPIWLANRSATTNYDGVAIFNDVTLGLGTPGSYLIIISAKEGYGKHPLILHAFTSVVATIRSIEQVAPISTGENEDHVVRYRKPFSFEVDVEVELSQGSIPAMATAQLQTGNFMYSAGVKDLGFSSSITTGKMHAAPDRAVLTGPTPDGSRPPSIARAGATVYGHQMSNETTEQPNFWKFRLSFVDMRVNGTNARSMYLTVSFWGRSIPLLFQNTRSEGMTPTQIYFPALFWFDGGEESLCPTSELIVYRASDPGKKQLFAFDSVYEGESLILKIKVTSPSTGGKDNQVPFFLDVSAHRGTPTAMGHHDVDQSPLSNPKTYGTYGLSNLWKVTSTDQKGDAEFPFFFSYTGSTGLYDLALSLDGANAPWSGVGDYDTKYPSHANPKNDFLNLTLNVMSSVTQWLPNVSHAPWAKPYVTVGEPWVKMPTVQVYRALNVSELYALQGQGPSANTSATVTMAPSIDMPVTVPLPGKMMQLTPVDAGEDEIKIYVESQSGDERGLISPKTIRILYAREERNYTFSVTVDGIVVGHYTAEVRWPRRNSNVCIPTFDDAPDYSYSGVPARLDFTIRDIYARPIPHAHATISEISQSKTSVHPAQTNVNGTGHYGPQTLGITVFHIAKFTIGCSFENTTAMTHKETSPLLITLTPRFKGLLGMNSTDNGTKISMELDVIWDQVSWNAPLFVSVSQLWHPRWVHNTEWNNGGSPVNYNVNPFFFTSKENLELTTTGHAPGLYMNDVQFDYATFALNPHFYLPPVAKSIRLTRSIFGAASNNTFRFDTAFTTPAQVEVTMNQTDVHQIVFAQLGYLPPPEDWPHSQSDPSVTLDNYTWIWAFEEDSQFGYVVPLPHDLSPVAGSSNLMRATLNKKTLEGLRGDGYRYKLRYCTTVDLQDASVITAPAPMSTVCVEETETFTIDLFVHPYPRQLIISPRAIAIAPGQKIPEFNITCVDSDDGLPCSASIQYSVDVSPGMRSHGASIQCNNLGVRHTIHKEAFHFHSGGPLPGGPTGYEGTVTIGGVRSGCFVSETTPEGKYLLYAYGAGSRSSPMVITVTDEVADLAVSVGAFPPGSNYSLNSVIPVTVEATTVTGAASANSPVELVELVYKHKCEGDACGSLSSGSQITGTTDKSGRATLPISFEAGATGEFEFYAKTASTQSNVGLKQNTLAGLTTVADRCGAPKYLLPQLAPEAADTTEILLKLSKIAIKQANNAGAIVDEVKARVAGFNEGSYTTLTSSAEEVRSQALTSLKTIKSPMQKFTLQNPVQSIRIIEQNSAMYNKPASISELVEIKETVTLGNSTLVYQLLDVEGAPVPHSPITFSVANPGAKFLTDRFQVPGQTVSDENGILSVSGLKVHFSAAGKFDVILSAQGGGRTVVKDALVFTVTRIKTGTLMKYIAFILVACYAPLLLASVPHSRIIYGALGIFFTFGILGFTVWYVNGTYPTANSALVRFYLVFGAAVCALMCTINIVGMTLDLLGRKMIKLRFMNDEARAAKVVRYVDFVVNVRIDKQMAEQEKEAFEKAQKERAKVAAKRLKDKNPSGPSAQARANALMSDRFGVELAELKDDKEKGFKKVVERPPLEIPKDVDQAIALPVNYLIVLAITSVLVFATTLLMVWLLTRVKGLLASLLNYLPNPTSAGDMQEASNVIINSIDVALPFFLSLHPQFSFLTHMIEPLRNLNFIGGMLEMRNFVEAFKERLQLAWGIGITIAILVMFLTAFLTARSVKKTVLAVRRGQTTDLLPNGLSLVLVDAYIGLHCFHFIITYQIVAWIFILVALVLSVGPIVTFLLDQLLVIILASILSIVLEMLLKKVFIGWFLTSGFTILRPEMFAMWHYPGFILGIFTGLMKSIVRWGMGMGAVCGMFAMLNVSIFPGPMVMMDAAHKGFLSVVVSSAKQSNPIYLTFVAIVMKEMHLRRLAEEALRDGVDFPQPQEQQQNGGGGEGGEGTEAGLLQNEENPEEVNREPIINGKENGKEGTDEDFVLASVDTDTMHIAFPDGAGSCSLNKYGLSAAVVNLGRVLARREAAPGLNKLELWTAPHTRTLQLLNSKYHPDVRAKKERVANRWWLLWVLHQNPSLRKLRKHNLYRQHEEVEVEVERPDEINTLDDVSLTDGPSNEEGTPVNE